VSALRGIAALIAAGEGNEAIARATGRSLRRVQAVRQQLREQEQGPARALAVEEIPVRPPSARRRPWSPQEQARHRAELLAALRGAA
jgi:hypothetical protein